MRSLENNMNARNWHKLRIVMALIFASGLIRPAQQPVLATTEPPQSFKIDLHGPSGSGAFGTEVIALPNGNFVVTDPDYSAGGLANLGAVYLYNGSTREYLGVLTGSQAGDRVGSNGVYILSSGDFVVASSQWANVSGSSETPSGTVTFWVDEEAGVTRNLANGSASYTPAWLAPGPHTLMVTYSGDTVYLEASVSLDPVLVVLNGVYLPITKRYS